MRNCLITDVPTSTKFKGEYISARVLRIARYLRDRRNEEFFNVKDLKTAKMPVYFKMKLLKARKKARWTTRQILIEWSGRKLKTMSKSQQVMQQISRRF